MPSSDYTAATGGSLKLKGVAGSKIEKHKKKRKRPKEEEREEVPAGQKQQQQQQQKEAWSENSKLQSEEDAASRNAGAVIATSKSAGAKDTEEETVGTSRGGGEEEEEEEEEAPDAGARNDELELEPGYGVNKTEAERRHEEQRRRRRGNLPILHACFNPAFGLSFYTISEKRTGKKKDGAEEARNETARSRTFYGSD
ncbi:hypothetical protein MMC06_006733 [Schaereria dolodes]|nr:hypothetical protein [Schaereria dolodes]